MSLQQFCQWLNDSSTGIAIRESTLMFPFIATVHVLSIALLVGTVAIVDLRLLGLVLKRDPVSQVAGQILPLTWCGFVVTFLSGLLLFWAGAEKLYANPAFRLKLLLLLMAGLNPLVFHLTIYRSVNRWGAEGTIPSQAKLAAILSLTLWSGIIITGRAIAYF